MPVAFLLAPAAVSVAKAASIWVGYYIAGGALGGAGLTGSTWLLFFRSNKKIVQKHLDSLIAQHKITEERIQVANLTLSLLRQSVSHLSQEIALEVSSASASGERLQFLSQRLVSTNKKLGSIILDFSHF